MYQGKRVLLIAGGGTLGTYVSRELLRLGASVEVICPEEKISHHENLTFHQSLVSETLLKELFSQKHYDGIVNFIHYENAENYKKIHPLLIQNTDHLIFLSSYRVYADEQHPITESAPRLSDVLTEADFFQNDTYAYPKSLCEDYLKNERKGEPFTIVRPVISFSDKRLDLFMYSGDRVLRAPETGEILPLPHFAKNFKAGLDWAGNSGKLIANLLFKPEAIGEIFTIYSGHGMTWGEVAEAYERQTGLQVRYCSEEEFLAYNPDITESKARSFIWRCDRRFNRDIDASKVLRVTGLSKKDFATIEEGIAEELKNLGWKKA